MPKNVQIPLTESENQEITDFVNKLPKSQNVNSSTALFRLFKNLILEGKVSIESKTELKIKN